MERSQRSRVVALVGSLAVLGAAAVAVVVLFPPESEPEPGRAHEHGASRAATEAARSSMGASSAAKAGATARDAGPGGASSTVDETPPAPREPDRFSREADACRETCAEEVAECHADNDRTEPGYSLRYDECNRAFAECNVDCHAREGDARRAAEIAPPR